MEKEIEQLPFPGAVKCTKCGLYGSKYVMQFHSNEHIDDESDLSRFTEILCPNCRKEREDEKQLKEICICAAVKTECGKVIRGHRHCFCFQTILYMGLKIDRRSSAQGFITSRNRFVSREEGRKLQDAAGIPSADLPEGYKGKTLFSEDLY